MFVVGVAVVQAQRLVGGEGEERGRLGGTVWIDVRLWDVGL